METTNQKIYIVYIYGIANGSNEVVKLIYIFKSLQNAQKFVDIETRNINHNYGSWTQKKVEIFNDRGLNFDDWRVE